jgi:hypothetical protein
VVAVQADNDDEQEGGDSSGVKDNDDAHTTTRADEDEVSLLSDCAQRCYQILTYLMKYANAAQFNHAVDASTVRTYYDFIRFPLCLTDIKAHLLAGKYENSLSLFYRDVRLVFLNAFTFNGDGSAVSSSALKLACVFDRLFFEGVLSVPSSNTTTNTTTNTSVKSCDSKYQPDCCLECRSTYEDDEGYTVLCDR